MRKKKPLELNILKVVAAEYSAKKAALVEYVDRAMDDDPQVEVLIGHNPRQVMYTNHRNHAEFMGNVLLFNQSDLLARMLPWVYSSYHAHGFSYDYFPRALACWMEGIRVLFSDEASKAVLPVYEWILQRHALTVEEAENPSVVASGPDSERWQSVRTAYLAAVLAGDMYEARQTAEAAVQGPEDMRGFYLEVLQPAMYEIGRRWQTGEISVAQEHLATAIAGRVMASFYVRFLNRRPTKGSAVITASPNEFHELGARMIADFLELDGWDTAFLGADTPTDELIRLLRARPHDLLGVSVTMPFNLDKVAELVRKVRAVPELSTLKIMVGGNAFHMAEDIQNTLQVDGYANDAATAVALANQWREVA